MRPHRSLVAAATALLSMLPVPASAHSVPCVDGPTRLASADRPHVEDPDGDGAAPWVQILGPGAEIINAWVTGPSAWEDRLSTEKFKATIRVENLDRHPFPGRHYFTFLDEDGNTQFVRSESDGTDMGWLFSYGSLVDTTFTRVGATAGSVNASAGTITMEIHPSQLPPRPADGKPLALEIVEVETYLRLPANPGVGVSNLQSTDIATPSCGLLLYEEAPPEQLP
jgi:hypothetical protein